MVEYVRNNDEEEGKVGDTEADEGRNCIRK